MRVVESPVSGCSCGLNPTSGVYSPPRNAGRRCGADVRFSHEPQRILDSGENCCHSGPASRWLRLLNDNPCRILRPLAAGSFIAAFPVSGFRSPCFLLHCRHEQRPPHSGSQVCHPSPVQRSLEKKFPVQPGLDPKKSRRSVPEK